MSGIISSINYYIPSFPDTPPLGTAQLPEDPPPPDAPISPPTPPTHESFCAEFGRFLDRDKILTYVRNGHEIYNTYGKLTTEELSQKKSDANSDAETHEKQQCAHLLWYFMWAAHQKGESFREGSFVIEDPNATILHLFQSRSFIRLSSHLKDQKAGNHWGFDPISELPLGKRHALVIPLDKGYTFIKPENYSTNWVELPAHATELLVAQARKLNSAPLQLLLGTDHDVGMRKERIPEGLVTEFKELTHGMEHSEAAHKAASEERVGGGIGAMYNYLVLALANHQFSDDQRKIKLENFIKALVVKYGRDNIERRIGEEVYIALNMPPPPPSPKQ